MLAVKTQDIKRWQKIKDGEGKDKLQNELDHITNAVDKARKAVSYLWNLKGRLPIPNVNAVANTNEIEGEMLIKIVNINGWTMCGNQKNMASIWERWYLTNERQSITKLDAQNVATKLNSIGYKKGEGEGGWVADAGAWHIGGFRYGGQ